MKSLDEMEQYLEEMIEMCDAQIFEYRVANNQSTARWYETRKDYSEHLLALIKSGKDEERDDE